MLRFLGCGAKPKAAEPCEAENPERMDKLKCRAGSQSLPPVWEAAVSAGSARGPAWSFRCVFVEGLSEKELSAMPLAQKSVELAPGEEVMLGRTHSIIQGLLKVCPDNSKFISRMHAELHVHRVTSSASVTNCSWNPVFVGGRCIASGEESAVDHNQTVSFARPDGCGGFTKFLVFRGHDPLLQTGADMDDAMTTMLLSAEAPRAPTMASTLCRWRLRCVLAEPLSAQDLDALSSETRCLQMTDGTMFIGRRHQPDFFGGLLTKRPGNLKFVSRTHAELGVWRDGEECHLLLTNRSPNYLFVDSRVLGENESAPLRHGQLLSFARPDEADDGLLVHFLRIIIEDTQYALPLEEEAPAEAPTLEAQAPRTLSMESLRPPPLSEDGFTMVFTSVQESQALWRDLPDAMLQALGMHDETIRGVLAKHSGEEVEADCGAFQLAFHDVFDAVQFCLECQAALLECDWPEALLGHDQAAASEDGAWRGLRVRMGLHTGQLAVTEDGRTGRMMYTGPCVTVARAIEGVCEGGQIMMSSATFEKVSKAWSKLGDPQVVDLGEHSLCSGRTIPRAEEVEEVEQPPSSHGAAAPEPQPSGLCRRATAPVEAQARERGAARAASAIDLCRRVADEAALASPTAEGSPAAEVASLAEEVASEEVASCRLYQLLPSALAHDFSRDGVRQPGEAGGRRFGPLRGSRRLSPGFAEAPSGADITLCFAVAHGAKRLKVLKPESATEALAQLRGVVQEALECASGYACQEEDGTYMVAFASMRRAVDFAAAVQHGLLRLPWSDEVRDVGPEFCAGLRMAMGIGRGPCSSKRPHPATGRADYYGAVVYRTARIVATAKAGQVLLEGVDGSDVGGSSPAGAPGYELELLGSHELDGTCQPAILHELRVLEAPADAQESAPAARSPSEGGALAARSPASAMAPEKGSVARSSCSQKSDAEAPRGPRADARPCAAAAGRSPAAPAEVALVL